MLGWLIQDAMRLHRKNERFAKITHLATGYTSKYQHQKFPTLTSVNSMDRKDYHAPSAIFEKKNNQLRVFTQSLDYARHEDPTSFQKSRNQQLQNFFLFSFLEYAGELRIIALREKEKDQKSHTKPHTHSDTHLAYKRTRVTKEKRP